MKTINYKQMANLLFNLPNNKPIYIAGHLKPDQDSVCSCMALCQTLNNIGKTAKVLLSKKDFDILSWKNIYTNVVENVDKQNYIFIALDLNTKKRLGDFEALFDNAEQTFNIDHHEDNKQESDYILDRPQMSSTCEMIYKIIRLLDKNSLNKDVCEYLYAGMMTDTAGFTRRLTSQTLCIAQKLINNKIDYNYIIKTTFSNRTFYEFKAMAKIVNELNFDKFYYAVVDKEKPEYAKLSHNAIVKKIAEDIRKIEGFDIFLMLIKDKNSITAKVMANISNNADKIASIFGGGGHKKEAGFTVINTSVEEIVERTKVFLNA